jgi:hypothetical protein
MTWRYGSPITVARVHFDARSMTPFCERRLLLALRQTEHDAS